MRILFVTDTFVFGLGRTLFETCKYLAKNGHEVKVLASSPDKNIPAKRLLDGVEMNQYYLKEPKYRPHSVMFLFKMLFNNCRLSGKIHKLSPLNCIILYQPLPAIGVKLNPFLLKVPKIYSFLCPWHKEYELNVRLGEMNKINPKIWWYYINSAARKLVEKALKHGCKKVFVLTEYAKKELLETHKVNTELIEIIPGAIDTDKYKPIGAKDKLRLKLGMQKDNIILLTVRRLVPRMGLENLVRAMPTILKENPSAYLVIAGDGPLRESLIALTKSLGIENSVRFEGFVHMDKLPEYYSVADLFILPTVALEGFGYVTIEALSCELPVLGTDIGGTKEILNNFNPSLLFKGTAPEDIASLILQTVEKTQSELEEIGRSGREFVIKNYTWEIVGPKIENACKEVMS